MLLCGVTAVLCSPTTTGSPIKVYYEGGTTTSPPMVNYLNKGPSPNAIRLKTDSETQAAMMAKDRSYWVDRSLVFNTGRGDGNSTIHVEGPAGAGSEDRIVNGLDVDLGDMPMLARLSLDFTDGGFLYVNCLNHNIFARPEHQQLILCIFV